MKWFASLALLALASCIGGVPSQLSASSVPSSTISEEYARVVRVVRLGLAKVATFCASLADAVVSPEEVPCY